MGISLLRLNSSKTQFLQSWSQMPCHLKLLLLKGILLISHSLFTSLKELCILIEGSTLNYVIKVISGLLRVRHTACTVLSRFWDDILKLLFHSRVLESLTICRCLTPLNHVCNWHSNQQTGTVHLYTATYQVKKCIGSI